MDRRTIRTSGSAEDLEFFGETCGGHYHALRIYRNGKIEAEQVGARRSGGSLLFDYIPHEWWKLRNSLKWELSTYETSRPDWAVTIALIGHQKFGGERSDSPTCLWEQEEWDKAHPVPIWETDEFQFQFGGIVGMGRQI